MKKSVSRELSVCFKLDGNSEAGTASKDNVGRLLGVVVTAAEAKQPSERQRGECVRCTEFVLFPVVWGDLQLFLKL